VKLIPLFLLVGLLAVSGLAQINMPEPYSPELVQRAEAGDAVAQWSLGACYSRGDEIQKELSFKWLMKSAEQGNADAQYALREYYCLKANEYIRTSENLPLIEEARKMANEWCLKAAEGGCISAQGTLAHDYFYSHSKGAARINDLEEAKKWYTKLAKKGSKQDEKMIGQCEDAIKKEQRLLKTTKSK
jgi:TPR repeat protein